MEESVTGDKVTRFLFLFIWVCALRDTWKKMNCLMMNCHVTIADGCMALLVHRIRKGCDECMLIGWDGMSHPQLPSQSWW